MDSGDEDEINFGNKDFDRMKASLGKSGYREGIIKGKEVGMQQAFNDSYELGLKYGIFLGVLRGNIKARIAAMPEQAEGLKSLSDEVEKSCALLKKVPHFSSPQEQDKFIQNLEVKLEEYKAKLKSIEGAPE